MKTNKTISSVLAISIVVVAVLIFCSVCGAAENSSVKQEAAKSSASAVGSVAAKELADSYILRLLFANLQTPVETITFKKDRTGAHIRYNGMRKIRQAGYPSSIF